MKYVWIAYTDGYKSCYEEFGKTYSDTSDAISIKGVFDTEVGCRRFCIESDSSYKCKKYYVCLEAKEIEEDDTPCLTWEEGVK